jgi:hypothetical protein
MRRVYKDLFADHPVLFKDSTLRPEARGVSMGDSCDEKELIEKEFGPLWSGVDSISAGDRIFTSRELKKAFDLMADDVVVIDLHVLPEDLYAFRFYDGDDRCVVVFVFDRELNIVRELRAHIAEWLKDEYYKSGMEAFFAGNMVKMLRQKVKGGEDPSPPES